MLEEESGLTSGENSGVAFGETPDSASGGRFSVLLPDATSGKLASVPAWGSGWTGAGVHCCVVQPQMHDPAQYHARPTATKVAEAHAGSRELARNNRRRLHARLAPYETTRLPMDK